MPILTSKEEEMRKNHPLPFTNLIELECLQFFQDSQDTISIFEHDAYPNVYRAFKKFNTSLASSAPVERIFSYGKLIMTDRRTRLSDEMFEKLLVLKIKTRKLSV